MAALIASRKSVREMAWQSAALRFALAPASAAK